MKKTMLSTPSRIRSEPISAPIDTKESIGSKSISTPSTMPSTLAISVR